MGKLIDEVDLMKIRIKDLDRDKRYNELNRGGIK
jgi:hypothetical protein